MGVKTAVLHSRLKGISMLDAITIILPTRNEARNIPVFLASLPPAAPLIVVDASTDATPELVQQIRPYHTTLIRQPANVTLARQISAGLAQTPWLLFTDADVTFAPDYFDQAPALLRGDVVYGPKRSRGEFQSYYRWFSRGQQFMHRLGVPAASGSNLLVRRSAFQAVGGFDLTLNCNEDSELAWRLRRRGYAVHFAPELVVYEHDHRRLRRGRLRKTAHSLARCALLYANLMPARWRGHDWGYWSRREADATAVAPQDR